MLLVAPDSERFLYKNKATECGLEVCDWECEVCECVRVVTELAKYRFGLVGVQEVRWDKGDTEQCFCVWKEEQKASARDVNYCTLQEHTGR